MTRRQYARLCINLMVKGATCRGARTQSNRRPPMSRAWWTGWICCQDVLCLFRKPRTEARRSPVNCRAASDPEIPAWGQPLPQCLLLSDTRRTGRSERPHDQNESTDRSERIGGQHTRAPERRSRNVTMASCRRRARSRRSGGNSLSAGISSEPHPNGRSVSSACANTHRRITRATTAAGSDVGVGRPPRKSWPWEAITDRYRALAHGGMRR